MAEEDCRFPGAHKRVIRQHLDIQEALRQILWTHLCLDLSEQVRAGLFDLTGHRLSDKKKKVSKGKYVLREKDNLHSLVHFFTEI